MDASDILRIAKLSKLEFSPEDVPVYTERFQKIMEMVDAIQSVNTDNVAPMRHPFDATEARDTLRNDGPADPEGLLLTSADAPFFTVPKVIE